MDKCNQKQSIIIGENIKLMQQFNDLHEEHQSLNES